MVRVLFAGLILFIGFATAQASGSCGGKDTPCSVAMGSYHILVPDDGARRPLPAVVHFHGFGGSGAGVIGSQGMTAAILARGYALIAPNGMPREGRKGGTWSFIPGLPKRRDERAFVGQVLDDAAARFGIDRERILLTGFSIGGSLTWYMACEEPGAFAAYAPVAGGFWRPHPETCAGPVKLLHTHGWKDVTVPLEGRPVRGGAIRQGDIFEGFQVWRRMNGCGGGRPDRFDMTGPFWRRAWTDCAPGTALEMAMHAGAHGVPKGWADMALDWFETVVPRPAPAN